MYQFSRSLYRELAEEVRCDPRSRPGDTRLRFLGTCESAFERLAADRHYFARPARSLFRDVRDFFPLSAQLRVYQVIERHMAVATEYVDRHAQAGVTLDGVPSPATPPRARARRVSASPCRGPGTAPRTSTWTTASPSPPPDRGDHRPKSSRAAPPGLEIRAGLS
ncbi:MAG: hypothetical protein WKF31_00740 [Thermoleophilaceae bacterium]